MNFLEHLHKNDLFTIVCIIISYTFVWKLPSSMPRSVSIIMMLFSLDMAKGLDNTLAVKPFDLYDTNVLPYFDGSDALTWMLYPVFGYLFAYYYNRFNIRGIAIPAYICIWSCIGVAFEWLNVLFDVFQYKSWKLSYSFCIYLVVQTMFVLLFNFLKTKAVKSML